MAAYAADGQRVLTASNFASLHVYAGGTPRRIKVYEIFLSVFGGTLADSTLTWLIRGSTTAGTANGTVTPAPLDTADAVALATAKEDFHTTDPTFTRTLLQVSGPMRESKKWTCSREGRELVAPATANSGIAAGTTHASYVGSGDVTFHFEE